MKLHYSLKQVHDLASGGNVIASVSLPGLTAAPLLFRVTKSSCVLQPTG